MGVVAAIIILGILVTVHELGHFIVAKWCRVGVLEFSIGFGPILWARTFGETTYSLRAIPLGGFVRMAGDDPALVQQGKALDACDVGGASPIEGTQRLSPQQEAVLRDESKWFLKKPYLPRCAVVLAGPLFNFGFAWILAAGLYFAVGIPHIEDGPVTVGVVHEGLPAQAAGVKPGDKVISVNGQEVANFKAFVEIVRGSEGKELAVVVDRPKVAEGQAPSSASSSAPSSASSSATEFERVTLTIQPASGVAEMDVLEGREAQKTYRIGVTPAVTNVTYEPVSLLGAIGQGAQQVKGLSLQTLRVLRALLTGLISPRKSIGGPIEIIKQTAQSADEGIMAVISMMIFLNVSLGVFNLLPIPVLDGGHLTLFTIELIKGKPLSMRFQQAVTSVGMGLLLILMLFAIGNDIYRQLPLP